MSGSELTRHEMATRLVPSPLVYDLLVPADLPGRSPVLVWLHGGDGPDQFSGLTRPAFDKCWADETLAPMIVVIPHSTRSFWLDGVGEESAWESVLVEELVPHVQTSHEAGEVVLVGGVSMGGMGALRVAFRHPDRFSAVVAIEAAIEPVGEWADVSLRDRFYRDDALVGSLYGDPVEPERFRHNHPLMVAERHACEVAAAELAIYLECGDDDLLSLHHGVETLHRRLWEIGLLHEYRSVRGANHVGRTLGPRVVDGLGFLGRSLRDPSIDPEVEQLRKLARRAHDESGLRRRSLIAGPAGLIEVAEYGEGPPVLLVPSLGRGSTDFDDLAARLARAGYHAIHPEPRGIGGSTGPLDGLTMADLAADVAAVIHACADEPVTLVGHAFGNRVARMTATEYPHLIDSVVLLCCGGLVPPAPEYSAALLAVFDSDIPEADHLDAVGQAFFSPGNDPAVWYGGWHGAVAAAQGAATAAQPVDYWWGAGGKDLFIVQPADDVMAVAENATRICEEFGDRASMVTVPDAGHALLPEQPYAVEVAVRSWLTRPR